MAEVLDPDITYRGESTAAVLRRVPAHAIHILDVGCGPGNSSLVLRQRWPEAEVTGIDNSGTMIEQARGRYPDQSWVLADAMSYEADARFDVVFSNAAIQWIPDHERLIARFFGFLSEGGVVAIQLPIFYGMAAGQALARLARSPRWLQRTQGAIEEFTFHDYRYYFDLLVRYARAVDIWETDYVHVMPSHASILEMIRTTALRPYLSRLGNEENRRAFQNELLLQIKLQYPTQDDGQVLFPFRRLFMLGYR